MSPATRDTIRNLVRTRLDQLGLERLPTKEEVIEACEAIKTLSATKIFGEIDPEVVNDVCNKIIASYAVQFRIGDILKDTSVVPWLREAKAQIEPYYWKRYRKQLLEEAHWPPQVVSTLDDQADRILDLCGNPNQLGAWSRFGLVMGNVQSGKTANYLGLITKAADAGYRTFVVIAGMQNSLRSQTQARIDSGFVGYDSSKRNIQPIGVGTYDPDRRPFTFTTRIKDFHRTMAESFGGRLHDMSEPTVFVIKKNASVLKNLLEWLERNGIKPGQSHIDSPLFLIDDEADNASINTQYSRQEVTRINSSIRKLLGLFTRSTYVGYTATPFANIFIDPDTTNEMLGSDLFPRSFIVGLDAPSNYFGAEEIFIRHPDSYIRDIDDNESVLPVKHKKDDPLPDIPESLREAIRCFLVAVAIRKCRGDGNRHASMLINASRFILQQEMIWHHVNDYLQELAESCRAYGMLPAAQALVNRNIKALHDTWKKEYSEALSNWEEVQDALATSAPEIEAIKVNGSSKSRLDYDDYPRGRKIIAIGGLALSRGLTLEGLIVSYYLRSSVMYDTLMQMGRWFGYRDGYQDLCRIFMTEQSRDHYEHVANSIVELQHDLKLMEQAGATPVDFGLRVRSHPDTLMITAHNKAGRSEDLVLMVNYDKKLIETWLLDRNPSRIQANDAAAKRLAEAMLAIQKPMLERGSYVFQDIPVGDVLVFLRSYHNSVWPQSSLVLDYIEPRVNDELARWDVAFVGVSRSGESHAHPVQIGPMKIICQTRTLDPNNSSETTLAAKKSRIASRGDEKLGLSKEEIRRVESEYRKSKSQISGNLSYPDLIYRESRPRPLLMVHYIQFKDDGSSQLKLAPGKPVVAVSVSFPSTSINSEPVSYRLNAIATDELRRIQNVDETEDDPEFEKEDF